MKRFEKKIRSPFFLQVSSKLFLARTINSINIINTINTSNTINTVNAINIITSINTMNTINTTSTINTLILLILLMLVLLSRTALAQLVYPQQWALLFVRKVLGSSWNRSSYWYSTRRCYGTVRYLIAR